MVTSLVVYARQHEGLSIRLFSPFNEIDLGTSEGPGVNAQQSARLLGKVATRLSSLGMSDTKLTVPDVAIPSRMPEYLTAITADPTLMEHVADIAFHDYAGNIYDVQNFINNSAYPKIHYWLSEYSAWCEGCLTAPSQSESWALATNTADFLFNYLEQDANAALLWEGFDGYYYHHGDFQYWGIMSYDRTTGAFTPRHRYYTAQQIFRFVRPGMVRIGVQAPGSTLRILAFSDPASGALTIVGRNPTNAPVTLDLSLGGLASGKTLTLTQTTQNSHLATGTLTRTGDSISGQIAADSVFAISTSIPVPIPKTCAGSPRICLPLVVKPR
jgi:O-glycosyl hydrolase